MDIVNFDLMDQKFMAISAGPLFTFNPSISFSIACKTKNEVNALWKKLSKGGKVLMELGSYHFSERYGWTQDKHSLSWQIVPASMEKMMKTDDKEKLARVTEAFLKIKKFDIASLVRAYNG